MTGPREPAYQTACSDLSVANVVNPAPATRTIGPPQTARLMGGDGAFSIESWPCDDLEDTYIPLETLFIQAAVLGSRVFL